MDREQLLERAMERGVNRPFYRLVRLLFLPFFLIWFRQERIGSEHVPAEGPVIFAANHRSFLDPFAISGSSKRPLYFVAKKELFQKNRLQTWFISSLGAFPIDRGASDEDSMATARTILERGDGVMIFPEGTRVRPGPLGHPRRGVGRLALETGATVIPVAIIGSEDVRRGWRIRSRKVRVRCGAPMRFPKVERPSPALAKAVTDRIWPMVELQWEWLGGTPPLRRVTVIGAGSWGTGLAITLARAGVDVQLGCRTEEQARTLLAERENRHYLPGHRIPDTVAIARAGALDLHEADLVCLAVPTRDLPVAMGEIGDRLGSRTSLLVSSKGLVPPAGDLPSAFCAERAGGRVVACLGGPAHAGDALEHGASVVLACRDGEVLAQLRRLFADSGFDVETTRDVVGVDLAGVAKNAAVLAATTAAIGGPNAAGAAAGKVFSEIAAYAGTLGADPQTWTGLAGAGDLVASVVAAGGRNRRAGELLARGLPEREIRPAIGQVAESLDALPLLVTALEARGIRAPATRALAAVVDGEGSATAFADEVTKPRRIVGARVV